MLEIKMTRNILNNEEGQAMLESLPLIVVFIILFAYGMGLFGVIHSGILFSISARTYAFETFRNRTNTNIFRYSANADSRNLLYYSDIGFRYHLVTDGTNKVNGDIRASQRPIIVGLNREPQGDDVGTHNQNIYEDVVTGERNQAVAVHPAWLMIGYGLCINAQCGAE